MWPGRKGPPGGRPPPPPPAPTPRVGGAATAVVRPLPDAAGTDATVTAFDTALGKVLRELVAWTLRTGESAAA